VLYVESSSDVTNRVVTNQIFWNFQLVELTVFYRDLNVWHTWY